MAAEKWWRRTAEPCKNGELCLGTIDSWLIYKLTGGAFKTDYSNASRTQLFNLKMLSWDEKICGILTFRSAHWPRCVIPMPSME